MEIAKLPFVTCSESTTPVYANGYYKITEKETRGNMFSQYAHRNTHYELSFTQYFYEVLQYNKRNDKEVIMHKCGLNCTATFPVTYDYARSILIFHKPWRGVRRDMFKNREKVITTAIDFIMSPNCPSSVKQAYTRAKYCYETSRDIYDDNRNNEEANHDANENNMDEEVQTLLEFCNSFQRKAKNKDQFNGYSFDVGRNFNWGNCRNDDDGATWLLETIKEHDTWNQDTMLDNGEIILDNACLNIDTKYDMKKLKGNQQTIVCTVLNNLMKWIDFANGQSKQYEPLRMTVPGKAGTGKSFVINCIVNETRKILKHNYSAIVVAPTGAAAFNVNAQTIH